MVPGPLSNLRSKRQFMGSVQLAPSMSTTKLTRLAILWVATSILLLLPDFLLYWSGYSVTAALHDKPRIVALVLALLISTTAWRNFRMAAITFLALNQLIWTGYVVYFGKPLSPEHLLVFTMEVSDTFWGVLAEWRSLLPWLAALLASSALLVFIHWPERRTAEWRSHVSAWIILAVVIASPAIWLMAKRLEGAFPAAKTASMYGPFQALVGAVRIGMSHMAAGADFNVHGQTQQQIALPGEPVTVVVVMGESINPSRLSLFGFGRETTPRLARWRTTPPAGFSFIPKIGFSGGLDTYASVPTFLRTAYWPIEVQKFGVNLFELAYRQGFKSRYLSAQTMNFLTAAGGAPHAERIETREGNQQRYAAKRDDMLVEFAKEVPDTSEHNFVFIHQSVNHTAYTRNCLHAPQGMYVFKNEKGSADDERRASYDNGLRCWDRNVTMIAKQFLKRRGAVYIFITADHNELMGEDGGWGHGFDDLRVAMVPMMLLTNRPKSEVALLFKSWSPPTSYRLGQTIARALGVRLETADIAPNRFYTNSTMPFGLAGFIEAEQLKSGVYRVKRFARNGVLLGQKQAVLPEIAAANDVANAKDVAAAIKDNFADVLAESIQRRGDQGTATEIVRAQ